MTTSDERPNLYDLTPAALAETLEAAIAPPFRARQVRQWMLQRGVDSFAAMTDLPHAVREALDRRFTLSFPEVVEVTSPAPDGSCKYLFRLSDGNRIESVYMPMQERASVCLSSQAGCAVGCTFCVTGFFGAGRNLAPSEMLGQVFTVARRHSIERERLSVVFMGMGEPLLNFDNVAKTLETLYETIAPRRITLSTSGIVPGIQLLARMDRRPNLAVSINAPDQRRREEIMPITAKYPLADLIDALRRFPVEKGREITIEYVLIAGYNDSPDDAALLARLIARLKAKVNAIPLNEDPNLPAWMKRPSDAAVDAFVRALVRKRVRVTVRRSKGRDIAAACGQLRGKSEPPRRRAAGQR